MKIAVAFSGGVDSAVCVRLLQEQGHTVEAWHMLTLASEPAPAVVALADALGVPLRTVDLRADFEREVVAPFFADYAAGRGYPGRVVYGMLGASFFSTLAGVYLPGEHCLLHSVEAKFAKPVFVGDTLTVTGKVTEVNDTFGEITVKAVIENQNGQKVTRGLIKAGVAK